MIVEREKAVPLDKVCDTTVQTYVVPAYLLDQLVRSAHGLASASGALVKVLQRIKDGQAG